MHDNFTEINDNPVGRIFAFYCQRHQARRLRFLRNVIGNRRYVARRCTGADNHTIGDAGLALHVKCDNILAFKIINLINNELLECFTLQKVPLKTGDGGLTKSPNSALINWFTDEIVRRKSAAKNQAAQYSMTRSVAI